MKKLITKWVLIVLIVVGTLFLLGNKGEIITGYKSFILYLLVYLNVSQMLDD